MLTREEKEILKAIRGQLDAEQREAFDEMSDEEKKELVKEAKKEMAKQGGGGRAHSEGCLGRLRAIRDCPWREVLSDDGEYGGENAFAFTVLKLILKILFFWL